MKWVTKTKRRVAKLKEDNHQEEGDITQGGQPPRRGQHSSRKMTIGEGNKVKGSPRSGRPRPRRRW